MPVPDVALISLGTTPGLRRSDEAFAELLREAGASCELVTVRIGRAAGALRRHIAVTDLVEALAARRAARGVQARAFVYSTVTAAFLQPRRTVEAVRFDAPAALNRPGLAGAWQRAAERRRLRRVRLLLPLGERAEGAVRDALGGHRGRAAAGPLVVRVPIPVDEVEPAARRDIDAVAYAGYPRKRGLDVVCAAWAEAAPAGGRLAIGGVDRERGLAWLRRCGVPEPAGVEWLGALPRDEWLATLARTRVLLNGSRWEDYGMTQLEALAAGAALVTVPSPGPYEALPVARELAPALVAGEQTAPALASALKAGLALDRAAAAAYRERARALLAPYRRDAVLATVRDRVLPTLGVGR